MQLERETLLRGVKGVLDRLTMLQTQLVQGNIEELEKALISASRSRDAWMIETLSRNWQNQPEAAEHDGLLDRTMRTLLGEGITGK